MYDCNIMSSFIIKKYFLINKLKKGLYCILYDNITSKTTITYNGWNLIDY